MCALSAACSPQYNWREVHGDTTGEKGAANAPFTVLLPARADTFSQPVTLNGARVRMTMTAAEIDGVTFAVGAALFGDAAAAQNALPQMKEALMKNIDGRPLATPVPGKPFAGADPARTLTLNAVGATRGKPLRMTGRLYNFDRKVYQVIVVGDPNKISEEAAETFLASFQPG